MDNSQKVDRLCVKHPFMGRVFMREQVALSTGFIHTPAKALNGLRSIRGGRVFMRTIASLGFDVWLARQQQNAVLHAVDLGLWIDHLHLLERVSKAAPESLPPRFVLCVVSPKLRL